MGKKNAKIRAAMAKAEKSMAAKAKAWKAEGAAAGPAGAKTGYAEVAWIRSAMAELIKFRDELANIQWKTEVIVDSFDDWREHILQFSELSSLRGVPGSSLGMGEGKIFAKVSESDKNKLIIYLKGLGIRDLESFRSTLGILFNSDYEHSAFRDLREKRSGVNPNTMSDGDRRIFDSLMALDEQLSEICGKLGFLAWDIGECIGLCRHAYSAGLLSKEDLWAISVAKARFASEHYDDWGEYALSYASGGIYCLYLRMSCYKLSQTFATSYIKKHFSLLRKLTAPGGLWRTSFWPKYYEGGKKCLIHPRDLRILIPEYIVASKVLRAHLCPGFAFATNVLARATDRIMVDGAKVGLMYRESPRIVEDSGWRFAAGDESYDYKRKRKYFPVFHLSTISNYDPDIIEFLNMETGSVLRRTDGGPLHPVDG
jgi:hypothetical protein